MDELTTEISGSPQAHRIRASAKAEAYAVALAAAGGLQGEVWSGELSQLDLDPQEGFVLSRVNGEWDVASITKICPMGEQEVLIIFKRLLDEGLIELTE